MLIRKEFLQHIFEWTRLLGVPRMHAQVAFLIILMSKRTLIQCKSTLKQGMRAYVQCNKTFYLCKRYINLITRYSLY